MDFQKSYLKKKLLIDKKLRRFLNSLKELEELKKILRYSIFPGGKRLRPILTLSSAEIVGGEEIKVLPLACALELIHTHSLILDDLPCMDNDDIRRGKPTVHKIFGEDKAILAAEELLILAFRLIIENVKNIAPKLAWQIIWEITEAIGSDGLIAGQFLDLKYKGKKIEHLILKKIHFKKTAKLIIVSLRSGAILGGGNPQQIRALTKYGEKFGLAFQIIDDILDGNSNEELYNLAKKYTDEANQVLKIFEDKANFLQELAKYNLERKS